MKKWFLPTLVLVGLSAGILQVWFEDRPSSEPATADSGEEQSQVEPKGPKLTLGPLERDSTAQISASGPAPAAEHANGPSAADDLVSKLLEQTWEDNAAEDFYGDEEPEEYFIGGMVLDEDGNPISQVEVLAEWIEDSDDTHAVVDAELDSVHLALSDFDGSFLIGNLEDGEYRVRVVPVEGIAPAQVKVRAGTLDVRLVVVVLRDFQVYGIVQSTDGKPIEGVHIIVGPVTRSTKTGTSGEYELDISKHGKKVVHAINFQHEDFQPQRIHIDPADLDDPTMGLHLDVSMEPLKRLTTVAGSLKDTRGNPVGGKSLNIMTSGMQTKYRADSDANGNFRFEEVEPGKDYRLLIQPGSGYRNKDINPLVVPNDGLNLEIVLELTEEGELSGWMIDPDGQPVPGFPITLHSTIATGQSVGVTGDQQGFFRIENFPVGGALLRTNSYPVLTVRGVRVSSEPEEPVTLVLDTGSHFIRGRVVNLFGEPVAASNITLNWEFRFNRLLNSSTRNTMADSNGDFLFTGLGPGPHTMQVGAAGFNDMVLTVDTRLDPVDIVVELEEETD